MDTSGVITGLSTYPKSVKLHPGNKSNYKSPTLRRFKSKIILILLT